MHIFGDYYMQNKALKFNALVRVCGDCLGIKMGIILYKQKSPILSHWAYICSNEYLVEVFCLII